MSRDPPSDSRGGDDPDHAEVVIVGGGPAGCSAGVFLARYGLDTVIFDRGNASLARCAFLANYPGFPAGIDVETVRELLLDHAEESGCSVVADLVESVERAGENTESEGFVVETQDGRRVDTEEVVAATRYGGEHLRPLGGEEMFETHEHGGEEHEHFDRDYADEDGRTPIDGLYVASPAGERDVQAIVAAGRGAHAARTLLEDRRTERGYPEKLARHYDWLRPESEFEGEWRSRERWREWFDARVPEDHDASEERLDDLREAYVDAAFETRRSPEAVEELTAQAHRRLVEYVDDDAVLERADEIREERSG